MKKILLTIFTIVFLLLISYFSKAQVSGYTFAPSAGTYTAITGGTILRDGTAAMDSWVSGAITIPAFTFNCVSYTTVYVTSNGLLTLGAPAPSSTAYNGISSGSGSGVCICPFNADILNVNSTATSEIRWQTVAPEVIFQWKQMKRYLATENFSFQVRLNTTTGAIKFVYDAVTANPDNSTSYQPEVGIRTSSTDYKNIKIGSGAETWAAPLAGTANTDICRFTNTATAKKFLDGQTYTWTPPAACAGAPAAGTATPSPASVCTGSTSTITLTGYTTGCGISYQWQSASAIGGPYTDIGSATSTSYLATLSATTYYRCITTCSNGGGTNTSSIATVTVTAPTYATVPYSESFEGPWISSCDTREIPTINWLNTPKTGDRSWRRHDDGVAAAGWSSNTGLYSPVSSAGSYSAEFNSFNAASGTTGSLDLYIDMSPAGTKTLLFDYINPGTATANDKMVVLLSTDGGSTFPTTLLTLPAPVASWTTQSVNIASTSATCVIRFLATSDYGSTNENTGIDNLLVVLPCAGTPTAGNAVATPGSICPGLTSVLTLSGSSVSGGLTYQWQSSPNPITVWTNIGGATSSSYSTSPTISTNCRCVVTCSNSGLSANSASALVTVDIGTYATLPYTQGFEGPWLSVCNTRDAPDNSWRVSPLTGNRSWRRDDDGIAGAAWSSSLGAYSPLFSAGAHSARYHAYNTSLTGSLDLYVNCSPAGTKVLCFDYILNSLSSASMSVLLSTDGGATFPITLGSITTADSWTNFSYNITSTSATCVVRFLADGDNGSYDIGMDNLSLSVPGVPNCATYTTPANGASGITCGINALMNWTPNGPTCYPPTSYDVYFGTAASPPFVVNQTGTQYNPGTLLPSTTYYWKILPRNASGAAVCATIWSFATGASFNAAQTSPPITDGFETCTDWTIVNGAQPNIWLRGTATAYTGSRSMYINNTGSNNNYNENAASTVHFYKDIIFPAGNNDFSLKFYWKGEGESTYDYLRVFLAPTSITPAAGTEVSSTYELTPYIYNQSATWQYFSYPMPIACGGNETWRLIFSWDNDGSGGTQPPIAVDDIQVTMTARTGSTCANPVNITLPFTRTGETTNCMNNDYTTASTASCGSSYESGNDKVYKVLVGAAGCITVSLTNTSSTSLGFQIYSGCPDVGGSTCIFNSTTGAPGNTLTTDVNIPSAGYYYLIVDNWSAPTYVDYDISITAPGSNTASDPPCGAVPLTLGIAAAGDNTCTNGSGEPAAPGCWTNGLINTVWYKVVLPASQDISIRTTAGSLLNTQIALYTVGACGTPGTFTLKGCNDDAPSCNTGYDNSELTVLNVAAAGTTVYIVVDGFQDQAGTFSILVVDGNNGSPVWPPIVGQDCGPVLTYTNPVCGQTTSIDNPGYFAFGNFCDFDGTGICLTSGEKSSVWYTINVNANGTLAFDIVPNDYGNPNPLTGQVNTGWTTSGDETDYDWAIWKWESACDGNVILTGSSWFNFVC
ncbi:MAG: hypothetical protein A3F72_13555 [Bacteroidetes bacterium RIFCSPLOWO2_12_FULL_35_15]|nr:MAG: hypothetical protein A3F72_13555 [Bacteroidetes bacterium RIFCSPLOWO2_12_FULL_35_15]